MGMLGNSAAETDPPLDQLLHRAPRNLQRSREDLHRSLSGERDLGAEVGGGGNLSQEEHNAYLAEKRKGMAMFAGI